MTPPIWFAAPLAAWVPPVLADVWKTTPFVALLLLAGLQNIDRSLYEAAAMDGADAWRQFVGVTLPLLRPALLVALLFRALDAFRVFDVVYVMTGGGPGTATEPIALYTFTTLLQNLRFGYGSALSVLMFAVAFGLGAGSHPADRPRRHPGAVRHDRSTVACAWRRSRDHRAPRAAVVLGHRLVAHARATVVRGAVAVPHDLTLDHYRALFEQRDFWTADPQLAGGRHGDHGVVGGPWRRLCVRAGAAALSRKRRGPGVRARRSRCFRRSRSSPRSTCCCASCTCSNTYPGLVLPYLTFAMPLTIWLLVGFFRQLPPDLEEAALLDGAGRLRTLWEIVLPLAAPGLATTAILTFLYSWNEFLFALSFTLGPERYTVPVAIALFRGQYQVPWGEILAAAVVATAPVAAIVLLAQRRIVAGLTAGAVKG